VEVQRAAVDAVAQARLAGPIVEHVAEVAAAAGARHLGPDHAVRGVGRGLDRLSEHGVGEAGPTGARLELGVRVEQGVAAAGAAIHAVALLIDVLARPRALGGLVAKDLVCGGVELLAPLLLCLLDLFHMPVRPVGRPTRYANGGAASGVRRPSRRPGDEVSARLATLPWCNPPFPVA